MLKNPLLVGFFFFFFFTNHSKGASGHLWASERFLNQFPATTSCLFAHISQERYTCYCSSPLFHGTLTATDGQLFLFSFIHRFELSLTSDHPIIYVVKNNRATAAVSLLHLHVLNMVSNLEYHEGNCLSWRL